MTAPMQMDLPVTQPPQPGPDSFTLQDWTQILHNAAQVKQDHPRYSEARAAVDEALRRIGTIHQQQNAADSAAARLDPRTSFAENLAQGASMGIGSTIGDALGQGTSDFLAQSRSQNPKSAIAGDLVGGGGVSTILAALGVPAPIAVGGPAGLQAGLETKSPAIGAITGVTTGLGSKVVGKVTGALGINALAGKAVGALAKKLATTGAEIADEELIGNMSAGAIRRNLARQGFTPAQVEQKVAQARMAIVAQHAAQPIGGPLEDIAQAQADFKAGKISEADLNTAMETAGKQSGMASGSPSTPAAAIPTPPPTTPQVPGTMGPIAGTSGRGFEVTGTRATPPPPTAPTITEIQDRLAGLGKGKTLPYYPRGGKAEQALTPSPKVSMPPEPGEFSPQLTQVHQVLLDLRQRLGRTLTPDEREMVLGQLLGAGSPERAMANAFGSLAPR